MKWKEYLSDIRIFEEKQDRTWLIGVKSDKALQYKACQQLSVKFSTIHMMVWVKIRSRP